MTGAVMLVSMGEANIVVVIQDLGIPFWGFFILWTSQIVAIYSIGFAASNMFKIEEEKL